MESSATLKLLEYRQTASSILWANKSQNNNVNFKLYCAVRFGPSLRRPDVCTESDLHSSNNIPRVPFNRMRLMSIVNKVMLCISAGMFEGRPSCWLYLPRGKCISLELSGFVCFCSITLAKTCWKIRFVLLFRIIDSRE